MSELLDRLKKRQEMAKESVATYVEAISHAADSDTLYTLLRDLQKAESTACMIGQVVSYHEQLEKRQAAAS